jgi:Histone H1-like protein Hc1
MRRGMADSTEATFIMQEYETLKRLVTEAEDDVRKAEGGNKAAGTRVRKKMQEIKAAAQDVRKKVLEGRDAEGDTAGSAAGGDAAGEEA